MSDPVPSLSDRPPHSQPPPAPSSVPSHHHSAHPDDGDGGDDVALRLRKRTYLTLLPLESVLDICLTFERYAPPSVKAEQWPSDLDAAIATLSQVAPPSSSTSGATTPSAAAAAASVIDAIVSAQQNLTSDVPEVKPVVKDEAFASAAHAPFPNLPFKFANPSTNPHTTPYYTGAPSFPPLVPTGFSSYGAPPHQAHPLLPQHASPTPDHGMPTGASVGDDLPSYEEMIVEGLVELSAMDPEGAAPKTLFHWMGNRWPLQTNFRPSASQALQKAYKRGRLEKSQHGKYRLNPTWEGGSTSRRATRRPQTQAQSVASIPVPHPSPSFSLASTNPYTYGMPAHPTPSFSAFTPTPGPSTAAPTPLPAPSLEPSDEHVNAAIGEAESLAQRLLLRLNYTPPTSDVMQSATTATIGESSAPAPSMGPGDRAALQEQLSILATQLTQIAHEGGLDVSEELTSGWSTALGEDDGPGEDTPMEEVGVEPVIPKTEDVELGLSHRTSRDAT